MEISPRRILGGLLMLVGIGVGLAGLAGHGPREWMFAGAGVLIVAGGGLFFDPNRAGGDLGLGD